MSPNSSGYLLANKQNKKEDSWTFLFKKQKQVYQTEKESQNFFGQKKNKKYWETLIYIARMTDSDEDSWFINEPYLKKKTAYYLS